MTYARHKNALITKLRKDFRRPKSLVRMFPTHFRCLMNHLNSQSLEEQSHPEAMVYTERQINHSEHLFRMINECSLTTFSFLSGHALESLVSNSSLNAYSEYTVRQKTISKLEPNIHIYNHRCATTHRGRGLRRCL